MSVPQTARALDPAAIEWRQGELQDCSKVAAFAATAFDPQFREAWSESQISGLLSSQSAWLELGQHDDRVVAFALSRQMLDEVELLLCAVEPSYRRSGVGRRLMRNVVEVACTRSANRIFLEVRDGNAAALSLYTATGFEICGRRPAYYRTLSGDSIDAITLQRSI